MPHPRNPRLFQFEAHPVFLVPQSNIIFCRWPEENSSLEKRFSIMSTNSGHIDLNADAVFVDRENEATGFDSSESNVRVGVSKSDNVVVKIRDHEFCGVGDGLGNGLVMPGYAEMSCGTGQECFDKETELVYRGNDMEAGAEFVGGVIRRTDKCLGSELNHGVMNELEYGYKGGVTGNGSTSIKFELNKEVQGGETKILCPHVEQNAKGDFGNEENGRGLNCRADEIADQGAVTVVGDENKVKAANNKVSRDCLEDPCALRTVESTCQLLDGILHMEAKDSEFKESLLHEVSIARNHLCHVETSCILKQPSLKVCAQAEVIQSQTMGINMIEALPLENIQNKFIGLDLVVDFNPYRNLQEVVMDMKSVSSELNFCVSDLVWGKVRGHPWWPGQIFDPSAASEKAKRYFKKGNYLIAYFGDQTFAWNDASKIKPFQMYFSQMEKQSSLENFYHAIDCALDEISRRVEFGLSCPCMPEVFTSLKTQIITNAGIQKHSIRRDGRDRFLNAITFEPMKLVNFIKLLAKSPHLEYDRLSFAIARSQLLAFRRANSYPQLSEFVVNDMEIIPIEEKGQYDHQIDCLGLETDIGYSHKRKLISRRDCGRPCKKQKRLSDLMSGKRLSLPNDKHVLRRETDGHESILHSSAYKQRPSMDASDDHCHKSQTIKLIHLHNVSVDEMCSQLRLAASNPNIDGYLAGMVNFFAGFRNFSSPHNSTPLEFHVDSYWTDRIIQSIHEEQSKNRNEREEFLLVNPTGAGYPSFELKAAADGKEHLDESSEEDSCPAALILEFTNLDSIPSETNLNKIFGPFGPLIESQTEVLERSRHAKVVFKRLSDAESAFSSAGKYSIFGPSLYRYHLKVMPSSSIATVRAGKRGRK